MNLHDLKFLEKPQIRVPFAMLVIGASQQGKSSFVSDLIKNSDVVFSQNFDEIVYSFLSEQPSIQTDKDIRYMEGLDLDILNTNHGQCLYVCDDLMSQFQGDYFVKLMTTARHSNISVIVMLHDLYFKGKHFTSGTRSATHLVLFGNPRDKSSVKTLSYQINPSYPKFLYSAWEDATRAAYNPLVVDLLPNTPENLRYLTGILPGQICFSYLPA